MSGVPGHPVRDEPISIDEFHRRPGQGRTVQHLVQHLSSITVDYRNGVFAGVNDTVEKIGGRAPLSVAEFVARDRAYFRASGPYSATS